MSRARTLANLGGVTSSSTELNLLDGQTDIASQAELDAVSTTVTANESDADKIQTNLAVLAIRQAADHNDVKYSLQDRIIDTYYDASGIDGGPSTNHVLTSGVYKGSGTPTITENATTTGTDGLYSWYRWSAATASGSFVTDTAQNIEFLIVAGGGGGGMSRTHGGTGSGGGGAGGYLEKDVHAITATTYPIVVGAGGAGGTGHGAGTIGANSVAFGATANGGGYGAGGDSPSVGGDGGSGGGGAFSNPSGGSQWAGGSATPGSALNGATAYGYDGGDGSEGSYQGGGGGAGGVGGDAADGTGGNGRANDIMNKTTPTSVTYAGGGGGYSLEAGGSGGGGQGAASGTHGQNGTDGLGGGGGGGSHWNSGNGGTGGCGVVIIRRLTTVNADLTLQSIDTAAETEADYADMVMLIEDSGGTPAVINTDIKGFISEDSGVTFTEGVLVDEGDWGTNKRILAFHDLDISAQSGTAMCYKIRTYNQSASKETKIHATSIGWR